MIEPNKTHDLLSELNQQAPDFTAMLRALTPKTFIVFLAAEDMKRYEIACCISIKRCDAIEMVEVNDGYNKT